LRSTTSPFPLLCNCNEQSVQLTWETFDLVSCPTIRSSSSTESTSGFAELRQCWSTIAWLLRRERAKYRVQLSLQGLSCCGIPYFTPVLINGVEYGSVFQKSILMTHDLRHHGLIGLLNPFVSCPRIGLHGTAPITKNPLALLCLCRPKLLLLEMNTAFQLHGKLWCISKAYAIADRIAYAHANPKILCRDDLDGLQTKEMKMTCYFWKP